MDEKQIRTIIAQVFEANGAEIDADDVVLSFGVRMPRSIARAGYGAWAECLGRLVLANSRPCGPIQTPMIEFSGKFGRLTAIQQKQVVAHEACHLFATDNHGARCANAMESAGYKPVAVGVE